MKIIKLIKRNLLGFIVGIIIATGVTTVALSVASKDVTYNNTNVESAINDLYSKISSGGGIFMAMETQGRSARTIDVAAFITTNNLNLDYTKLTNDNFFWSGEGAQANTTINTNKVWWISKPTLSYNVSTGKLSVGASYNDNVFMNGITYLVVVN